MTKPTVSKHWRKPVGLSDKAWIPPGPLHHVTVGRTSMRIGRLFRVRFPAARKSHNARFYTQITQATQSKTRLAREIEHVLIWRKPYHVTNSSHVIGNFLRIRCVRCVYKTLRACVACMRYVRWVRWKPRFTPVKQQDYITLENYL